MLGVCGEDIYFVAPSSDQNIKLRKSGDEWNLKFKLLLDREGSIELYKETAEYLYRFPVGSDLLEETARLLSVMPPAEILRPRAYTVAEFVALLEGSDPPVHLTPTKKVRSQFQFEGGWFELADVSFPQYRVQSVS